MAIKWLAGSQQEGIGCDPRSDIYLCVVWMLCLCLLSVLLSRVPFCFQSVIAGRGSCITTRSQTARGSMCTICMNQLLNSIFCFRWRSMSRLCLPWVPPTVSTAPSTLGKAKALCLSLVRWPVTCPTLHCYPQRLTTKVCFISYP